jgi:DeoR/GlpR family transcriptional regulator of sugar metabolism
MRMTSSRELARQLGVSETAVRRAEKAGRIKREANGSWISDEAASRHLPGPPPAERRDAGVDPEAPAG